ncbi:hypothetical protein Indivirus_7_7 [Indivirus ILV1]|uniref:Haloacid dehalogenase-like hydrolase n=1 Tax=Indivirus ILV1 TaxID=1977633 RepID=A0A1V0SE73_9VIRU|nr:hypothetical protein Indivirus_7_7 [Indivirus ILV1]
MNYQIKYHKYKTKYLNLKHQKGGNGKKILIFDFDQTISRVSIAHSPSLSEGLIHKDKLCDLFRNDEFINELKEFKSKGNIVAILSYGFRKHIDEFLKICEITELFNTILTPINFGLSEGTDWSNKLDGKNKMILALVNFLSLTNQIKDNNQIMFVDDNIQNINRAFHAGYSVILSNKTGLDIKKKDVLIKFMKSEYIRLDSCKKSIDIEKCEDGYTFKYFQNGEVCCIKN